MKDPIDPTNDAYILDVRRLRAIINDPKYNDNSEVYLSITGDPEDAGSIFMQNIELSMEDDEPGNRLIITITPPKDFSE